MFPGPTPDILASIETIPGVIYQSNRSMAWDSFTFNLHNPFLADIAVRQAIATAVDSQEIIDKTVGQVDDSIEPLGSALILGHQEGYEDKVGELGFGRGDIEGARKILEDAGYTFADDGGLVDPSGTPAPELTIVHQMTAPVHAATANILSAVGREIGLTIRPQPTDSIGNTIRQADGYGYDIVFIGYTGTPLYASNADRRFTTTGNAGNGFANAEFDALISAALDTTDRGEMIDLVNQADQIMLSEVSLLPLYQRVTILAHRDDLVNIRDNSAGTHPGQGWFYNTEEWGYRQAD